MKETGANPAKAGGTTPGTFWRVREVTAERGSQGLATEEKLPVLH